MSYLTSDKIRIVGKISIQNIKEIEINAKTNEHPTIYIKGIISANIGMEEIKDKCFKERIALVELDENGKEKDYAIFDGIILNVEVKEEGNFFEVEIRGISASYLFDIEKKSCSFQNVNMTYSDILKEVIGEHKYIFTVGEDRKIGKPLIQYNETDWEFAKRLASHFNKPIQSDIITGNPRIWFGARFGNQPQKEYERLFNTNTYSIEISNKYYEVGKSLGLSKLYYIVYRIKDGRNFNIGDKVLFQDKKLIICEKEVKFEKGELVFYYTLARENYLSVIEYYNTDFTGLSLLGEIIKTESETVYLKLDIDGKNGEYPYKWTPTSGSLMYCMPKVGTKASLYFSSADERSGIATNSPRTNGGSDSKSEVTTKGFDNVQNRGMVTEHGKRMDLYPDIMRFSATGEVDGETGEIIKPLELLFDDETGIIAESNKNLSLIALNNIKIESNQSNTFQAPILLNVLRTTAYMELFLERIVPIGTYTMVTMLNEKKSQIEISLMPNDTTLMLNNMIDVYSYENIVYQARVYESHKPFNDAPVECEESFFGLALSVIAGVAGVALIAASILVTGPIVAGALCTAGFYALSKSKDIYENRHNYDSWEDFGIGLLEIGFSIAEGAIVGALTAAIPAGGLKLFKNTKIFKFAGNIKNKVVNTFLSKICSNPVGSKVLKFLTSGTLLGDISLFALTNVGEGIISRGLLAIFSEDVTLADVFDSKAIRNDLVVGVASGGIFHFGNKVRNSKKNKNESGNLLKTDNKNPVSNASNKPKTDASKEPNKCTGKDPVDLITGSFLINQCDLIINDILGDFALERLYESIYQDVSPIGKGWNLTIFSHLEFELNYIKVYTLDNRVEIFQMTEDNNYINTRDNDQTYILKALDTGYSLYNNITQTTMLYKDSGKLSAVVDKAGNKREYIYENNELKKITFASGQYFEFTFSNDKIVEIRDNLDRCIEYTYNGDYLTSAKIPNGGVETYSYNEQGFIKSVTDANGVTFVQNEYDEKGRVIYQKLPTGQEYTAIYDDERKINTHFIPKLNRVEKYHYNNQNVAEKIEYQDGTSEERRYDTWENLVYKKDRNGNITRYSYNRFRIFTKWTRNFL